MQIKQLQLAYAPEHDRILMRINSAEQQEVRCWLTRRMVKLLVPNLENIMQSMLASDRPLDDTAKKALLEMSREVSLFTADYKTPFQDHNLNTPLGPEPLLITQIEMKPSLEHATTDLTMKLCTAQGKGFEMRMAEQLQHGFIDLLVKTCEQAEWNLGLKTLPGIIERPESRHLN